MAERRLSLSVLPREIQVKILHFIPLNLWPYVNDLLPLGLELNCLWRLFNLDKIDDFSEDFIELLLRHASRIKALTWNFATWDSRLNCSLVLQRLNNLEHLDIAFHQSVTDLFFLYHLRNLRSLDLCGLCIIDSYQFEIILPMLDRLDTLNVADCSVSKECIWQLVRSRDEANQFQYMNVRDCFSVDIGEILELSCDISHFEFCSLLMYDSMDTWLEIMDDYTHLHMCAASAEILEDYSGN